MKDLQVVGIGKGDMISLVGADRGYDEIRLSVYRNQYFGVVGKEGANSAEAVSLLAQSGSKGSGHSRIIMSHTGAVGRRSDDAVDPVGVGVELVVAKFEGHIQVDHDAGQ